MDRRSDIAVAQHPESQEGYSNLLGEEHSPNVWRNIGEGISNTPDDEVLEWRCLLHERGPILVLGENSLTNKAIRKLKHYSQLILGIVGFYSAWPLDLWHHLRKKERHCRTTDIVSRTPTCVRS